MTASTDNRAFTGDGSNLDRGRVASAWAGPVAASTILKTGCLAGQLYTDTANPPALVDYVADGSMRCVGFVTLGCDNSAGVLNARFAAVISETGCLVDKNAGGGNAIGPADVFSPIYGADNQTCSKLPADGPLIGILTGIDRQTLQPVVLVDPLTAIWMSTRQVIPISIPLAALLVGGGIAAAYTPSFPGRILAVSYSTTLPGAGAGATFVMSVKIAGVPTTGGLATLTLANQTQGAELQGSAITALNRFQGGQQITLVNAAGTVFTAGQVQANLLVGP